MRLWDELKKRKEGIAIGGGIGLGIFFLGKYWLAKDAVQSIISMAATNPSPVATAWSWATADYRVAAMFIVGGAAIGALIDKR